MERRERRKCSTCSGDRRHSGRTGGQSSTGIVSSEQAPKGQAATQCPQEMHSASAPGIDSGGASSPRVRIPTGQTATQIPSRRHFFSSTMKRLMRSSRPAVRPRHVGQVYTRRQPRATPPTERQNVSPADDARSDPRLTAAAPAPTIRGTHAKERDDHPLQVDLPAARRAPRGAPAARSPGSLLHPQFWAEDGTLFFQEAFNHGFLATILQPASGYLHSFPRLVAGFSLLVPMEQAPLVFNLAAFVVQLIPALYLLSPRMARIIPSFSARALAALLYVALPASCETHVNLTNSHWHLALTAVCILSATPAADPRTRALETSWWLFFP